MPTPPVLLSASDGVVSWHATRAELDRDLFAKLQRSKGARKTVTLRRVSNLVSAIPTAAIIR
ncbi:hypothetical protein [Dongia deserti]|uniref:hypothetical protein n=1 Tax=Dongia deserti TaxID=2268030 RepID=UPI0013C46310|nr:hypothetical protein [Dongia deserti]